MSLCFFDLFCHLCGFFLLKWSRWMEWCDMPPLTWPLNAHACSSCMPTNQGPEPRQWVHIRDWWFSVEDDDGMIFRWGFSAKVWLVSGQVFSLRWANVLFRGWFVSAVCRSYFEQGGLFPKSSPMGPAQGGSPQLEPPPRSPKPGQPVRPVARTQACTGAGADLF